MKKPTRSSSLKKTLSRSRTSARCVGRGLSFQRIEVLRKQWPSFGAHSKSTSKKSIPSTQEDFPTVVLDHEEALKHRESRGLHREGGSGKNAQEWPELLRDCGRQGFDDSYVLQQLLRQAVSLLQIRQAVAGNPDLSCAVLPNQNPKREIDGDAGSGQHEGRSCFGITQVKRAAYTMISGIRASITRRSASPSSAGLGYRIAK
jgi:hypothetical protein